MESNPFILYFQLPSALGQFGAAAECSRLPPLPPGSFYLGFHPYPPSEQVLAAEQVCKLTALSMWDLAELPPHGPAKVFVREDELDQTYESESGAVLYHPLTSPAACRKAEAVGLTLFNITADVRDRLFADAAWNNSGDAQVGHVVFLLVMARNTLTNSIDAFGGMVYCHPFQRRYTFRDAWKRLMTSVGTGDPLGPDPPAVAAAVVVPLHPEWTCPAYPRDTYVTWGGQPRQAFGPVHEMIGYPLLNVGIIRETALWFSCMLLPRSFNNGQVGLVARLPDGAMTGARVAARPFYLGKPTNATPEVKRVKDPRNAKDSPPEEEFIAYTPTLCLPLMTEGENPQPIALSFEQQMMAGVDQPRQLTFMPIQTMGFATMTEIVARAEARLEKVVLSIKSRAAARVQKLAQRSSEVIFTTLKETVKELEKATDMAYGSVESAEKRSAELFTRAGEASTATPHEPPAPADDAPAEESQPAVAESKAAKKQKKDKNKDKSKPKQNPVVTAIFEGMDAAKGSGALAQGEAHALLGKRDELASSLRQRFNDALTAFRSERSAEMVSDEQALRDGKAAFRRSIRDSFEDSHLQGLSPTSMIIQGSCLSLMTQVENRAQDRVDAAQDQAERMLDLVQNMFLEALPSLVFLKSSDVGTLDVTLKIFLTLLQWVRELGALSFPMGSGTTPSTRSKTGELLLSSEVVSAAVGRYMTPEAVATALVGALRERVPSEPSRVGLVRDELIEFLRPLTRKLAAEAIEGAQKTHAVACMRDLSTEEWVDIFKALVRKGLSKEDNLSAFLSNIMNSNKDTWSRILSAAAAGAPEAVSETALEVVKAALPAVLQSPLGMTSLCSALNNTDHSEQVSTALRTFVGDFADDFLRNSLTRPGGSEPIKELIEKEVAASVNKYVLGIAASTREQAERRVVTEAKAWRDKFREDIKEELKAELGVASDGRVALPTDAEDRLRGLEKELSSEEAAWKKDLKENILTHVRELMRNRSPGAIGAPGLSSVVSPFIPQRSSFASGSPGLVPPAPGTKRSGHSPGDGTTPLRKKLRDEGVIELDAEGEDPEQEPSTPSSRKSTAERQRGSARRGTPRGDPPAPRRNPPRVSVTERELGIKSEPALRDDAAVDNVGCDDLPPEGPRGEQEIEPEIEHRSEAKGDEDDGEEDEVGEGDEGESPGDRVWTTRDNWQARLKSLNKAQLLELDSEKRILKKSGEPPAGYEGEDCLNAAAISRLGDYEANRKFRLDWASMDETDRANLVGAAGVAGPAAIGFGWLAMVHWAKSRDPMILPIEVVEKGVYSHGKYAAHLPSLKNLSSEDQTALDKTMAACSWLLGERRKSKLGMSNDTGNISEKELTREFVTLVYDTPLTRLGFHGFSQISQVLCPFFAPYVLRSFTIPGHSSTKYFCPFCRYAVSNGHTMNAHIRNHLSLAAVCGHCLQATMGTQETLFTNHWDKECPARARPAEPTGKTSSAKKASTKSSKR